MFWATLLVTWGGAEDLIIIAWSKRSYFETNRKERKLVSQPVFSCPNGLCGRLELLQTGLCSTPHGLRRQKLGFRIVQICNYDILYEVRPEHQTRPSFRSSGTAGSGDEIIRVQSLSHFDKHGRRSLELCSLCRSFDTRARARIINIFINYKHIHNKWITLCGCG